MRSTSEFVVVLFLSVSAIAAESASNAAWLGFPILGRDKQPPEINLVKGQSLGSAFLLQLHRQAVLLAARVFDEAIPLAFSVMVIVLSKIANIRKSTQVFS